MTTVFNAEKTATEYAKPSLFLGAPMGLLDTVHKHFPTLWDYYKKMKSLDWDENEFDYSTCLHEFETCDPKTAEIMMRTLMWQWEADSVASRAPLSLIAPFCSSGELYAVEQRINDNEVLHSATYSEIVRMSYSNPRKVLSEMLEYKETFARLDKVVEFLDSFYQLSHEYALGKHMKTDAEILTEIAKFYFVLLCLERIQFMASFAITFTICETGLFQPIGTAVRKIAQDELEIHCEYRKEVLRLIGEMENGKVAIEAAKPAIQDFLKEVVNSELEWTDYLFSEGRNLVGVTPELIKKWVLFNAKAVDGALELGGLFDYPEKNPLPHLSDWFNVSAFQPSPQEQIGNQYKIITVKQDDADLDIL